MKTKSRWVSWRMIGVLLALPLLGMTTTAFAAAPPLSNAISSTPVILSTPPAPSALASQPIGIQVQEEQDEEALSTPAVSQAINQALSTLPALEVGPNQTAQSSITVDGFTLVEKVSNVATGDPLSEASYSVSAYDSAGLFLWSATYSDVFSWNGKSCTASPPSWSWNSAWWLFLTTFYPGTGSVTNFGTDSYSDSNASVKIQLTQYGTLFDTYLSGYAYMYDNGDWYAGIS